MDPVVGASNSTYNFDRWIKSGILIAKIVISSFENGTEMQKL
jgi:hypothetical protein